MWWIVAVGFSLILCTFSIRNMWINWNENPIVITFDENMTPISSIPFPVVTICSETKSHRDTFNYTDTIRMLNQKVNISQER